MNIIQSFYQIDRKICYQYGNHNDNYLINYYSMLLSYITLKKLYGKVTVYCNSFAYEKLLKFIPYDDVVLEEIDFITEGNYNTEWGMLKFHVFEKQTEPFIHLDTDVFLFKDLLSEFIDGDYDGIIQSYDFADEIYGAFYRSNREKLIRHRLIDDEKTSKLIQNFGECAGYNNGVVGFKNMEFLKKYIERAREYNWLINRNAFSDVNHQTIIFEQFNLLHTGLQDNVKMYEIIPYSLVKETDFNTAGNKIGYTHLLSGNKYVGYFVMLIREKIKKQYPEYVQYLEEFEKTIVDANIIFSNHMNLHKYINKVT